MYGAAISASYKTLGCDCNYNNDYYLTLAGTFGSVFNALIRLVVGLLFDFLSFKSLFGILLVF